MKRWIKTVGFALAVLNVLMLLASFIPAPILMPASHLAFADSGNSVAADPGQTQDTAQNNCKRCLKCHGFWRCLWCAVVCVVNMFN